MTSTKLKKLSVALNIIAAACSMLVGIPWLIRRHDFHMPDSQKSDESANHLRKVMQKLQNSGYSSLTADERALIANSMKHYK
ncbi:MAG: hypothetical protein C7K11_00235 [Candidatus Amulumruptor caecigallinarius]|uniref:Uncharacterized protein n=1 Tax=Candidatus Amulumruptor caecigallinarius TaxID=2109911 RepID=A0A4Q0UB75_9BACT|nr:MAG: hypothetical protein C7K11_00235 [Candidatus Amulumruptor caecigallinarius]HJE38632.1 hypothetical protein [Candidatus Amulumruptor caecigallinarius]